MATRRHRAENSRRNGRRRDADGPVWRATVELRSAPPALAVPSTLRVPACGNIKECMAGLCGPALCVSNKITGDRRCWDFDRSGSGASKRVEARRARLVWHCRSAGSMPHLPALHPGRRRRLPKRRILGYAERRVGRGSRSRRACRMLPRRWLGLFTFGSVRPAFSYANGVID